MSITAKLNVSMFLKWSPSTRCNRIHFWCEKLKYSDKAGRTRKFIYVVEYTSIIRHKSRCQNFCILMVR